ncbi:DNA annealing helicase and endonuclease ZRANB3 isoform X3 [Hippoglossus hippoglossus]|uniref:DNA annealing helicase and endonuclease ZRANB3 isoform X3 n=1 Tax=Hippoglossus hippoglossus TaxID=8267 RepID=UPI00148D65F5|nr:DNA annealing helicase and endonuclease ZRANB3 isoform X3 [Hippoglossus hippoglossus]
MEMDDNGLQTSHCDTRWSQQLSGLPPKLLQRLMSFQREGVEFALSRNGRCMIADEMGLGKTVQAIAVACAFRQEWPLLVVVPSSLKYPWIEELERWIPELRPGDINLVENKSHTMGISSSKVTVLGYGLLTTDSRPLVEALTRQQFAVVVVDESHYLKSRNAARTKILVPFIQRAKRAILLTGTPALGRPEELFMQIDALYPKSFGTWTDFAKKFCNARYRYFGSRRQWDCRGASNLEELHQRLSQIMIRRLKAEVLTQLPPKIRQRIPFDLPKEAAKEASASFAKWERLMTGLGSGVTATDTPFTEVMGLVTQMYKQTAIAKAGAVKDYIKMMLEAEQLKFLVFAHHLTMLQACTEAVIEAKAGYIRIDGSVPSSERIQLVHKFQSDPQTRVAVLSIQAAGQGLTLTAASHVVFAELYWNPGHIKQAEDRAHRIGQTASVNVHYLIAKGTFDTVMWSMLNKKETVTGSTLNGRKGYLKADEGDKDKWEFLNFADAWTPSEMVLPPLEGNSGDGKDDLFFSHFEKDKQHDIRSFFSPSMEKKRKRTGDEETSPSISSETTDAPAGSSTSSEKRREKSQTATTPDLDFSPQLKRLRTQHPSPSPRSRFEGKRRSAAGGIGAGSPRSPSSFMAPRKLSEPGPSTGTWDCGSCTYSNSSLLPYCEMCEFPRSSSAAPEPPRPQQPPSAERDQTCVVLSSSDSEPELSLGKAQPLKPCKDKQSEEEEEEEKGKDELLKDKQKLGEAEEEDKRRLKGKQSAGERGDNVAGGGSCLPPDHTPDRRAAACLSSAADANDDDEDNDGDDGSTTRPVYPGLQFCASQYTDRIYLYSKDGTALNLSFIPLDIKLTSWDELPEAFTRRRENRIQVLRFVQEWGSLAAMKKKLLRRSGLLFHSPTLGLQQLATAQRPHSSTKRYLSKDEVAEASLSKVQQEGGSVRLVVKENFFTKRSSASSLTPPASERKDKESGEAAEAAEEQASLQSAYLQAVDTEGVPLCLSCQQACSTSGGAWDTRFCSHRCQEEFQLRSSQTYMRSRVLEVEQGVCQLCGLHAHDLFLKVRDAPPPQRKEMLENTWLAQLSLKQLNEMIRAPVEGDFWQVDHIRPVYSGGGQCSLDNLQTLCTVCHRSRTAQQAKERSRIRKSAAASKVASDIRALTTARTVNTPGRRLL